MSGDLQVRGPLLGGAGTPSPLTAGVSGAQRVQDAHARYSQAVMENRVFFTSLANASPTAYVGAAGGTPLLSMFNPLTSGKVFFPLLVGFAQRAIITAAGQTELALWAGATATVTGTQVAARSMMSMLAAGSQAYCVNNTATTGSTALNLVLPLYTHYWATAAGAFSSPGFFDIGGLPAIYPGNMAALGVTTVPTTLTVDISVIWEEVSYIPQA